MFSVELIEELKKAKGFAKDIQAAEVIPNLTRANLSHIKSGSRHLTEEQALFIASECGLSNEWVLVNLAEEKAKSELAKQAWANIAKKISRSASAAVLALIVVFGGLAQNHGPSPRFA